jgi:ElaA protein
MQNQLIWQLKKFDELSTKEVYEILRLRSEVFVVEQACVFLDMDNLDFDSHHLQGRVDGNLVAYVRILPPGLAYAEPSIGRVITSPAHRKVGAGIELMEKAVEKTISLYGKVPIMIGAQLYLKKFYEKFGFRKCSDVYMEDGIEHIKMIREV